MAAKIVGFPRSSAHRIKAERLRSVFGPTGSSWSFRKTKCLTPAITANSGEEIHIHQVANNNVHYTRPDDCIAHDTLRAIGTLTTNEPINPDRQRTRNAALSWSPKSRSSSAGIRKPRSTPYSSPRTASSPCHHESILPFALHSGLAEMQRNTTFGTWLRKARKPATVPSRFSR